MCSVRGFGAPNEGIYLGDGLGTTDYPGNVNSFDSDGLVR